RRSHARLARRGAPPRRGRVEPRRGPRAADRARPRRGAAAPRRGAPRRRPAGDEWSLGEALAQRIALAVDGALQYRERAHVAQTLQASLLPAALPDIPGATVAAQYVASGEES